MGETEEYEVRESVQIWHLFENGWVLSDSDNPNIRRPKDVLKQVILRRIGSNMQGVTDEVLRESTKRGKESIVSGLEQKHGTIPAKIDWSWRNR